MTQHDVLEFLQFTRPTHVHAQRRRELGECWVEVSKAGGAVGFPFLPVGYDEVAPAAEALIAGLDPQRGRLLVATVGGDLAGWLNLRRDPHLLIAHWGTVHHVQTHLAHRGTGVGAALMQGPGTRRGRTWACSSCAWPHVLAWAWRTSTAGSVGRRLAGGPARCGWPTAMTGTRS